MITPPWEERSDDYWSCCDPDIELVGEADRCPICGASAS
jgi:hypothetical protein